MRSNAVSKLRILSLDGGEARCLSQLEILREFMHRLNMDTGVKRRPCDYFDWIGGVGAGGVVATLLVTFSMSVDEALVSFARICAAVFPDEQCTPAARASNLGAIMKALLEEYKISPEAQLMDESNPTIICRLGLFYMAAVNLGRCRLFRNYESRQASFNPTILEAIKVVWATPGLFPPVQVGPGTLQEELVSAASGFNNPTLEVIKEAHQVFGSDASVSILMSLGAGRATISAVGSDGSTSIKTLEQLAMDCENTADEVQRRIGRLGIYFRFSVDRGLEFDTPSSSVGKIAAHTAQYLLDDQVGSRLDICIVSAEQDSRITLEQLYRSRTKSPASLRGLPPLSSFFVMRKEPMDALIKTLVDDNSSEQHIMVLAGLGGSGKTQLTLKFARDFEDSFQLIIFVDASSADNIKKGLLTRIRALGREYSPETVEEVLDILANSQNPLLRNWLIIYDNADDPTLDLRTFIPPCDSGAILITTRNTTLKHMAPRGFLELDVMSLEEAITALLAAALAPGVEPTPRDRQTAARIVELLGYLPVAIIQAGCYIRQQECLHEYEDRLKSNRKGTLERAAKYQRDPLRYSHSVYAAFDVTIDVLSSGARRMLNLLSTVHFSNFPRTLISVAAKFKFGFEILELLDRPASFQKTVAFLMELFCPSGSWDEEVLASLLEELQQYSLVVLVPSTTTVTLRLHPLVHSWAQDRMSSEEQALYRDAAIRLVACGAEWVNVVLYEYLTPHVTVLSSNWNDLHVNDRIAWLRILAPDGDPKIRIEQFQGIYDEVKDAVGEGDIRTTRATLELADAYGELGDLEKMEQMEAEVVKVREALLGREDLETIEAMGNLASTYLSQERYDEAEALEFEALKLRTEKLGVCHKYTADSMELMAEIFLKQDRYVEAGALLETVVETRKTLLGQTHPWTIDAMVMLADCHNSQGHHAEADAFRQEILTLESTNLGSQHIETLRTMKWTARAYIDQGRFKEAEKLAEQAMTTMKEVLGIQNQETLDAVGICARVYQELGYSSAAETLRKEELAVRRTLEGDRSIATLNVLSWLAQAYLDQKKYPQMLEVAKELFEGRNEVLGEKHNETLIAFDWLGRAYQETGQYQEAENLRRKEVEVRKLVQGEQDIRTLRAISWLAKSLHDQNRSAEAEVLRREEIEGRRKELDGKLDVELLHAISWLVHALQAQGRPEEMEVAAKELLEGRVQVQGEDHLDTLNAYQWVARSYLDGRKYAEAESTWIHLWKRRSAIQGPNHIDTLAVKGWLGRVAYEQGRHAEALAIREEEVALRLDALGSRHATVFDAQEWIVRAYFDLQRYDEAESMARQVLASRSTVIGEMDPSTINSRAWVAASLRRKGRLADAAALYERILQERMQLWGAHHALVALTKSRLGQVYEGMGRRDEARLLAEEAVVLQRELLKPDDPALKETLDLLEKLDKPPVSDGPGHQEPSDASSNNTSLPAGTAVQEPATSPPGATAVSGSATHAAQQLPSQEVHESDQLSTDIDDQSPQSIPQSTATPPHLLPRSFSPFQQRDKFGRHPNPWSMFM